MWLPQPPMARVYWLERARRVGPLAPTLGQLSSLAGGQGGDAASQMAPPPQGLAAVAAACSCGGRAARQRAARIRMLAAGTSR